MSFRQVPWIFYQEGMGFLIKIQPQSPDSERFSPNRNHDSEMPPAESGKVHHGRFPGKRGAHHLVSLHVEYADRLCPARSGIHGQAAAI